MNKTKALNYLRLFIGILGFIVAIYTVILSLLTNLNVGNLLSLSLGFVLIFIGFIWHKISKNKLTFLIKAGVIAYIVFFGIMTSFIFISSKVNQTNFDEDALIVLGCAVHGETPSPTLYRRLENAVIYANKNPNALIVVSGGQGPQEKISEAEAMSRYLKEKGISADRIILEDKSTSTNENFKYTKEILSKKFDKNYSLCYITNDFHSYRANSLAKLNGFNPTSFNCKTDIFSFIPLYLRESLAVIKLWVFKQ